MITDPAYMQQIMDAMYRLTGKIRKSADSREAFQAIADEVRAISKADITIILIAEEGHPEFTLGGTSGIEASYLPLLNSIRVDENVRKRWLEHREMLPLRLDTPEQFPEVGREAVKKFGIGSAIVCPVIMREEFVGYIAVANKTQSPPLSENIAELLLPLSDAIALVVDNMRAYDLLKESKRDTERVLSMAPIGILTSDSRGIFKSVNKQMLVLLDKESEEGLIGTSVFELPPIARSGIDNLFLQAMEGHDAEKTDVHLVTRPDRASYVHVKATPVRSSGGDIEEILLVAMDTTSKVRLQNQLERSYEKLTQAYQELERVDKMKSQFIDVVSHELRTPLTVMRGYIDLVESEYMSKLDTKFATRLRIIRENTDRLYTLVENMLDLSRIEKGSLQIHFEPVRLDAILEEIVQTRMGDAEAKKQTLSLDIEGKLPLIMADRRRLKDVFSSIVDNALKYTQETGRIQVSARDEGKILHIWVKDNGIGIPLENLGKIFDRFHLVTSNDLSHQVDRLGLGLPIARGIIEAHGGKIWVESQVGKGSVFHVDLPKEHAK